jgi:hypothetical protein
MPSSKPGPLDLLDYNATYRILICRECQYAIQKSAISSHLLRHKIYREERQALLLFTDKLQLLQPEDVPLPASGTPAIDGLPIISGYRCISSPDCKSLCASLKRMKRHQRENHNVDDLSDIDAFAQPAKLQTFFRGTKLQYFEVSANLPDNAVRNHFTPVQDDIVVTSSKARTGIASSTDAFAAAATTRSVQSNSTHESTQESFRALDVDLNHLRYFYHYTTVMYFSLPSSPHNPHFWETFFIQQAMDHKWLMCGLLAISAYHLAISVAVESTEGRVHREHADRFGLECLNGLISSKRFGSSAATEQGSNELQLGDQVERVLRLARWASYANTANIDARNDRSNDFSLSSLVATLRELACFDGFITSLHNINDQAAIFAQAKSILNFDITTSSGLNPTNLTLLTRLKVLPAQLSEVFGRPDHVQEVLTTLHAIAALVVSCEISYASDDLQLVCGGMVGWLTMVTEHFDDMLARDSPVALVLLAYWATLIKRAEHCGAWCLAGIAERIVRGVDEKLAMDKSDLLTLVHDLFVP